MTKGPVVFPAFAGNDFQPWEMRQLVSALELRFQALEVSTDSLFDTDAFDSNEFAPIVHTHVEADITDLNHISSIFELDDVNGTPTNNQVLIWDGTQFLPGDVAGTGVSELADLSDVAGTVGAPSDNDLLQYNAFTGLWEAVDPTTIGISTSFAGLTDTDVTGQAQYDLLYNADGTNWHDTNGELQWNPTNNWLRLPANHAVRFGSNNLIEQNFQQAVTGDPNWSQVQLLAKFEGTDGATTYTELSGNAAAATFVNQAQIDTAQFRFGTASALFDGVSDSITFPDIAAYDLGTNDWTIEGFVRFNTLPPLETSLGPGYVLFSMQDAGGDLLTYAIIQDGFGYRVRIEGAAFAEVGTISGGISTGTWYHWAVTRDATGDNIRAYFNGNYETGDFGAAAADMGGPNQAIRIGALDAAGNGDHDGWIDNVRMTIGTARYTGTGTYTIPTTDFPEGPTVAATTTLIVGDPAVGTQIDGITTFTDYIEPVNIGDPGTEAGTISVNGVAYDSTLKVSDFGGAVEAMLHLHRHSDTLTPIMVASRARGNTSAHSNVLDNDVLLSLIATGWNTNTYNISSEIQMRVDGTPGATAMPGEIALMTAPSGTRAALDRMVIRADGSVEILDPGGTDSASFIHDGTDFITTFANTDRWLIDLNGVTIGAQTEESPLTFNVNAEFFQDIAMFQNQAGNGGYIRITNTNVAPVHTVGVQFEHNSPSAADGFIGWNAALDEVIIANSWTAPALLGVDPGSHVRIYNFNDETTYAQFQHQGTGTQFVTSFTNTPDWDITGLTGEMFVDADFRTSGDLTVGGTTTTINSNTVSIADNIITLNSDEAGVPTQDAGIEIERGTSLNVQLRWNETTDKWQVTEDGTLYYDILTDNDLPSGGLIVDGTVTDSMLRWSGTAWVEETQVRATAAGALQVLDSTLANGYQLSIAGTVATFAETAATLTQVQFGALTGASGYQFEDNVSVQSNTIRWNAASSQLWNFSSNGTDTFSITRSGTSGNELLIISDGASYLNASMTLGGANFNAADITNWTRGDQSENISGATWNWQDNVIQRAELTDYAVTHQTLSVVTNAATFDLTLGNSAFVDLQNVTGATLTLTLSNPPASGNYGEAHLIVEQHATAAKTITWPGSVTWIGATPTLSTTANARDAFHFFTIDAGTNWYGTAAISDTGLSLLGDLDDVTLTSPADGSMLLYDTGTGDWIDNVMSGDATMLDTGALTIANNAVTFAKMQDINTASFIGRTTAGTGDPENLTGTQATALLDLFATTSTVQGVVPGSNNLGATYYLDGSGTWSVPPGTPDQNLFETFTVTDTDSGYTWAATGSIVADTITDTGTFVSGANINIDVDATSDAIRWTFDPTTGFDMQDATITRPEFLDYAITHQTLTVTTDAATFDLTSGNSAFVDLQSVTGSNLTLTISNPPASGNYGECILWVEQHATTPKGITWPGSVTWQGSTPTLSSSANAIDMFHFSTRDGGTTWRGTYALDDAAATGTLAGLSDTDITAPADGAILIYDTGTATWRDFLLSGDATMNDSGVVTVADNSHNHTLSNVTDVTATAAEVNLLDLAGLTAGWGLIADTATTASWQQIDHVDLANIGTNTHAQIDTHIGDSTIHFTQGSISIPLSQISDVTATAAEVNLLDLAGLTAGWALIADTATTASWQAIPAGTLAGLTDTNITTPADGSLLLYDTLTGDWIDNPMSGDATILDTGALTIANNAVTFAKMQDINTASFIGRTTAGTGDPENLTGTQATALLDLFATTATTQGVVPGSNNLGATYYLDGSGTWSIPSGQPDQNLFETFTVTDTDVGFTWAETGSIVADTTTDTATFVSGTDIDIDVDAASDAIRIAFSNATGYTTNTGTVTSVGSGNGMNFTAITSTGDVTLGTPSSITDVSTNSVTATSHTHDITQAAITQYESALTILESQITDGSILARVAGTETISGTWTFSASPIIENTNPILYLRDTNATANEGNWVVSGGNDTFNIGTASDASPGSVVENAIVINRAGTAVSDVTIANGNLIVSENLTVNGTTTTINSNTVSIADNIITLNSDEAGAPTQDAGLEVERGTSANVFLQYDETADRWEFTNDGSTYYNIPLSTEYTTDHTALSNIGTNTHAQIDTHIGDSTIHFTQGSISIPLSQINDVTATAAEVNLLDLSGLTAGWALIADTATTASWQALPNQNPFDTPLRILGTQDELISGTGLLEFYDVDATTRTAFVGHSASIDLRIENEKHGGAVVLAAEDNAGTARLILDADPDATTTLYGDTTLQLVNRNLGGAGNVMLSRNTGETELYHNGVEIFQTTTSALGALTIDNDYNGLTSFERVLTESDKARTPALFELHFASNTDTGTATSSGTFKMNSATPASVTQIAVSNEQEEGPYDIDWVWSMVQVGDVIVVTSEVDDADWIVFEVTGTPVDNTTWFQINVSVLSSGAIFTANDDVWWHVQFTSRAAGTATIGGSIADNQVAVGAATANSIEGSANLTWDGAVLNVAGDIAADDTIILAGGAPYFELNETDATANEGRWRMRATADEYKLYTVTDAGVESVVFEVDRAAGVASNFDFRNMDNVRLLDGVDLVLYSPDLNTNFDISVADDNDMTIAATGAADINITGVTSLQAGTMDADFDAITATSYGGILEANLLDKTAAETITGSTWNFSDNIIQRPEFQDYAVTHQTLTVSTDAATFDITNGNSAYVDLQSVTGANLTLTISNPSASGNYCEINLMVEQHATAAKGITWPGSVTWISSTPTLSTSANAIDVFHFFTIDAGTTWYGTYVINDVAATVSALDDLSDVTLTTPADAALLLYDTGTAQWRDASMSGDVSITDTGVTTVTNVAAANVAAGNLVNGVLPYVDLQTGSSAFKVPFLNTTNNTAGNYGLVMDNGSAPTYNPATNVFGCVNFEASVQFLADNGAVGAPGYAFTGDANTGFYQGSVGSGIVGVSANGANVMNWASTLVTSLQTLRAADGLVVQGIVSDQGQAGQFGFVDVTGGFTRFGSYDYDLAAWQDVKIIGDNINIDTQGGVLYEGVISGTTGTGWKLSESYGMAFSSGTASGGWARGVVHHDHGGSTADAGFGFLGSNDSVTQFSVGFGASWWSTDEVFRIAPTQITIDPLITTLTAGSTDADFDAITATSYGGILEANLLDKSANEIVTGNWVFNVETIGDFVIDRQSTTGASGMLFRNDDGAKGYIGFGDDTSFRTWNTAGSPSGFIVTAGGAITATSYGGVLEANLLDKSATETVSGSWTFSGTTTTLTGTTVNVDTGTAFNFNQTTGTSPFTVDSTTVVTNLNADTVDGIQGANFLRSDTADTFNGTLSAATASIDMNDNTIIEAEMDDYCISNTSVTPTGTAQTCTYSTSQSYEVDLGSTTGNITITLSGGPPSGKYGEMIIKVTQHNTINRTITWSGGIFEWPGGTAPTMSTGADAIDIYHFSTWNGGTNWFGSVIQAMS